MLFITKDGLPERLIDRLSRLAAFQNPEFYRAQALRLSTFGKPRIIGCAEQFPSHPCATTRVRDEVKVDADCGITLEAEDKHERRGPDQHGVPGACCVPSNLRRSTPRWPTRSVFCAHPPRSAARWWLAAAIAAQKANT
jgi:hypothetical protein